MRDFRSVGMTSCTLALAGAFLGLAPVSVTAQELAGRSRIELRAGLGIRTSSGTSTSAGGVETETEAAGFLGAVGFSHWVRESLAFTAAVGVNSVGTKTSAGASGVETRTALVIPLFLGVRRYLPVSTFGSKWRPYVTGEVGPVLGHESASRVGSVIATESVTRAAVGGRVGVGVDILLGRSAALGVSGGYHLMTDFSEAIGGQKNHSGSDFGLAIGLLFGGAGQ